MSAGRFRNYFEQRVRPKLPSRRDIGDFAMVFGSVYMFTNYVVGFTVCVGPSMIPTIDPQGELTFIDRLSYKIGGKEYKTNDVVISTSMDDSRKTVCKRIRGVAGDVVFYRNKAGTPIIVKVPEEHVWLLGDNPSNSNDSRYYGPVPVSLLQGRVFAKIGTRPKFHACNIDKILAIEEPPSKAKVVEKNVEAHVEEKKEGLASSSEGRVVEHISGKVIESDKTAEDEDRAKPAQK